MEEGGGNDGKWRKERMNEIRGQARDWLERGGRVHLVLSMNIS